MNKAITYAKTCSSKLNKLMELKFFRNQTVVKLIGGLILFLVVLFFYYGRRSNNVLVKTQLVGSENQIKELLLPVGKNKTVEEITIALKKQYEAFNNKFPSKEEDAFKILSTTARNFKIAVLNFRPQGKSEYIFNESEKALLEGRKCYKIPISMNVKASFKNLVLYLEALEDAVSIEATVERLNITKDSSGEFNLNVALEITLYLLS